MNFIYLLLTPWGSSPLPSIHSFTSFSHSLGSEASVMSECGPGRERVKEIINFMMNDFLHLSPSLAKRVQRA